MVLSEQPYIEASASVTQCQLGSWTMVGPRTVILESSMGDYSYVMNDSSVHYAVIGKFCSIAAHTCINPGNHPLWRAALHHFSYRSRAYDLGFGDDHEFFQWRRAHQVVLGHDVWVGHGAVILPGVMVGTGAAVGAAAVVTKDVAPFTVVAGSPARVLRRR
jgi:phosphonate metabolism protein (transferase hexapeptide repeat family)